VAAISEFSSEKRLQASNKAVLSAGIIPPTRRSSSRRVPVTMTPIFSSLSIGSEGWSAADYVEKLYHGISCQRYLPGHRQSQHPVRGDHLMRTISIWMSYRASRTSTMNKRTFWVSNRLTNKVEQTRA